MRLSASRPRTGLSVPPDTVDSVTPSDATQLPDAIRIYLSASLTRDAEAVAPIFTPDACVIDDGGTHDGHAAVMQWFSREASQFTYTTTYLGSEVDPEGHWRIVNRLDGDFPGNTVTLTYTFRLATDGRIIQLAIAP